MMTNHIVIFIPRLGCCSKMAARSAQYERTLADLTLLFSYSGHGKASSIRAQGQDAAHGAAKDAPKVAAIVMRLDQRGALEVITFLQQALYYLQNVTLRRPRTAQPVRRPRRRRPHTSRTRSSTSCPARPSSGSTRVAARRGRGRALQRCAAWTRRPLAARASRAARTAGAAGAAGAGGCALTSLG